MASSRRWILRFVLAVVSRPRLTLAITLLATAACIVLAATRLRISADQNKLYSSDVPFFHDYLLFNKEFPENEALYVVIEAKGKNAAPPTERWTSAADAIVARLAKMPRQVVSATARVPTEAMGAQGVLFENPADLKRNVERTRAFVPLMKIMGEAPNLITKQLGATPIERLLSSLALAPPDEDTARFTALVANSLDDTLNTPAVPGKTPPPVLPDLAKLDSDSPQRLGYFYVPDETDKTRHLLLVRVVPKADYTSLTAQSETVEAIRAAVAEAAKAFGEFDVGLTGRPALEADEMRTTDTDSTRAEMVALSAVFIGVVILLRSVWTTMAAELALGVGIAWTFGWATVTLGELNLLSIVFMLALIGIGMDYLIQILSRYKREVSLRKNPKRVWVAVFRQVAAPINTATLGAAGAFLVSLVSGFAGAADLGLIAGGGLILCLISGYTFLPALLTVFPAGSGKKFTTEARRHGEEKNENKEYWVANDDVTHSTASTFPSLPPSPAPCLRASVVNILRQPRMRGPLTWILLLILGIPFALRTKFDAGLLELQAPDLPSVQLVRKLQTWSAVVLSKDVSALRAARDAIQNAPTVDHTESGLDASDNFAALTHDITPLPAVDWSPPVAPGASDIARLAEKAENLAQQWGNSAKRVQGLEFRVQGGTRRVADGSFRAVNGLETAVNAAFTAVNGSFTTVNAAFTAVNGSFTTVNAAFAPVNASFTTVNAAFAPVNGSFTTVNAAFAPVNASFTTVNAAFSLVNASFTPVNATFRAPSGFVLTDNAPVIAMLDPSTRPAAALASSDIASAAAALRQLAAALRKSPAEETAKRLAAWQAGFNEELQGMLDAFHPSPPDLAALPQELKHHFVSPSGYFALYIYPKEDLWNQAALDRFMNDVEPRIESVKKTSAPLLLTGIAHNIYHSTASIRVSFLRSTLLALALIVLLVLFDLRSLRQTLAAISVLALGLPMLAALMGLLGVDWNFANFFGLPILIGAGHEYGVFLVHRYREATGINGSGKRRGWSGWDVTDRALLLCAFVTSSSFGFFFLLAHHRGLKSLGLVMALGSLCIYLASVVVLRPILRARLATRNAKTSGGAGR